MRVVVNRIDSVRLVSPLLGGAASRMRQVKVPQTVADLKKHHVGVEVHGGFELSGVAPQLRHGRKSLYGSSEQGKTWGILNLRAADLHELLSDGQDSADLLMGVRIVGMAALEVGSIETGNPGHAYGSILRPQGVHLPTLSELGLTPQPLHGSIGLSLECIVWEVGEIPSSLLRDDLNEVIPRLLAKRETSVF